MNSASIIVIKVLHFLSTTQTRVASFLGPGWIAEQASQANARQCKAMQGKAKAMQGNARQAQCNAMSFAEASCVCVVVVVVVAVDVVCMACVTTIVKCFAGLCQDHGKCMLFRCKACSSLRAQTIALRKRKTSAALKPRTCVLHRAKKVAR